MVSSQRWSAHVLPPLRQWPWRSAGTCFTLLNRKFPSWMDPYGYIDVPYLSFSVCSGLVLKELHSQPEPFCPWQDSVTGWSGSTPKIRILLSPFKMWVTSCLEVRLCANIFAQIVWSCCVDLTTTIKTKKAFSFLGIWWPFPCVPQLWCALWSLRGRQCSVRQMRSER